MCESSAEPGALDARGLRHRRRLNDRGRRGYVALDGRADLSLCSNASIQPLISGCNREAIAASHALVRAGVLFPAIRPANVPAGTARLCISLSVAHAEQDLRCLVDAIRKAKRVWS